MHNSKFLILIVCTSLSMYAMQQGSELEEINTEVTQVFKKFEKGEMPDGLEIVSLERQIDILKSQPLTDDEENIRYSLKQRIERMGALINQEEREREKNERLWSRYW